MDTEGNPLPDGEVGELWVRGKNVMKGYWKRPQATRRTLQDGWLKTGDMGHRDADGFLFVTDRQKDMLLVLLRLVLHNHILQTGLRLLLLQVRS